MDDRNLIGSVTSSIELLSLVRARRKFRSPLKDETVKTRRRRRRRRPTKTKIKTKPNSNRKGT
jgi:hypothetical protein